MTTLKQHYCVNSMDTLQETRIATGKLKGIYNYEPKLSIIAVAMAQFLLCRNITSWWLKLIKSYQIHMLVCPLPPYSVHWPSKHPIFPVKLAPPGPSSIRPLWWWTPERYFLESFAFNLGYFSIFGFCSFSWLANMICSDLLVLSACLLVRCRYIHIGQNVSYNLYRWKQSSRDNHHPFFRKPKVSMIRAYFHSRWFSPPKNFHLRSLEHFPTSHEFPTVH